MIAAAAEVGELAPALAATAKVDVSGRTGPTASWCSSSTKANSRSATVVPDSVTKRRQR